MISVSHTLIYLSTFNVVQFVALQIHLKTEEVELLVTRRRVGEDAAIENLPAVTPASAAASKDEMLSLEDNETLSRLKIDFISSHEQHLVASIIIIFI